jgi:nitrite reductase/ring-hydroxylating ferredoxin subunit/uncharacterized membrane protein
MPKNWTGRLLSRLVEPVERAALLDPLAERLAQQVDRVRRSRRLIDLLSGTPLGHPVHPLLVTVPIGSWTGALVLDLIGNRSGARTLVGLGVLAALPAAATGLSDWRDTDGDERRVGLVHGSLNATLTGLYATSWLARRIGMHRLGVRLSYPALALLGVSGWLGGHLSYARGVGVDVTAWSPGRPNWTGAGPAASVTADRLHRVLIDGEPVLLTRTRDDRLVAYAERCSHRGGPLAEGRREGDCVVCPWHGSRFSLQDGSVRCGPATRPQPAYEVRVDDGQVRLRRSAKI